MNVKRLDWLADGLEARSIGAAALLAAATDVRSSLTNADSPVIVIA